MGWNILVRDSLSDNGQSPSPGLPYASPDIICTQQQTFTNPTTTFTNNYNSDPNQPVIVSQNNYLYMRGKNFGSTPSGGTVFLYWCPGSLLMTPNQWTKNALMANLNNKLQPYNLFPQVGQNGITVTQAPFLWTPQSLPSNEHYCTIGAVSTPQNPWTTADIPSFPTWDSFVMWVRTNQNICWRNITMISNPNPPDWDQVSLLSNQFRTQMFMALTVDCANVPVGTTIQLLCTQLNINQTTTVTNPNQKIAGPSAFVPPSTDSYVETIAHTPTSPWPPGATIQTTLYIGADSQADVATFAEDFGPLEQDPNIQRAKAQAAGRSGVGVLIQAGNCSMGYQPAA
jgi:hypothetical protein